MGRKAGPKLILQFGKSETDPENLYRAIVGVGQLVGVFVFGELLISTSYMGVAVQVQGAPGSSSPNGLPGVATAGPENGG